MTDETFDSYGHAVEEVEANKPLTVALSEYIEWLHERERREYVTRDAA